MKAYTDYPFMALGDRSGEIAPIRPIDVLAYDRNKYCLIMVENQTAIVKADYIYPHRGRCGEVPSFEKYWLIQLPSISEYQEKNRFNIIE